MFAPSTAIQQQQYSNSNNNNKNRHVRAHTHTHAPSHSFSSAAAWTAAGKAVSTIAKSATNTTRLQPSIFPFSLFSFCLFKKYPTQKSEAATVAFQSSEGLSKRA